MPRLSLLASAKKDIADQRQALASRAKRLKASQPKLLVFQAALRSAIDKSFAVSAAAGYCGNSSITIGTHWVAAGNGIPSRPSSCSNR